MNEPPLPHAIQNRTVTRRRRWLRIGLPLLLLLLVSAYATLPYWLPRNWLRERIAHDLTMLLDCPVRVGDLSLDWRDGVVLRDIVIADAATRGGRLLHIERVRCGLTPLRWAAGRGLDRLELLRPSVFVQINEDGRLNLASIEPDQGNPATHRWLVRDAVVHIINVSDAVTPAVSIGNLELTLDAVTGKAKVELSEGRLVRDVTVATPQGVWSAAANLVIPTTGTMTATTTRPAESPFHGELAFRWQDVDLASIPFHWWPDAAGIRLRGRCSGEIHGTARGDLAQSFELTLQAREVVWSRQTNDAEEQRLDLVRVAAAGRFSPTEEVLALSRFRLELPGATIRDRADPLDAATAAAEPFEWARRGETPVLLRAAVDVTDAERIPPAWLAAGWPAGARLGGAVRIDLDWRSTRRFDRLTFHAEGRNALLDVPDRLRIDGTLPLRVGGAVTFDWPRASFFAQDLTAVVGASYLGLSAEGPLLREGWMSLSAITGKTLPAMSDTNSSPGLPRPVHVSLKLTTSDAAQALDVFPWLRRELQARSPPVAIAASGPMSVACDIRPTQRGARFDAALTADGTSAIQIGDLFTKPAGRPLNLRAGLDLSSSDEESPTWYADDAILSASCGDAHAPQISADAQASWTSHQSPSGSEPGELVLQCDWTLAGIEDWLASSPAAQRLLANAVASDVELAGEVAARMVAQLSICNVDSEPYLTGGHASVIVDAEQLHGRAGEVWHKPPGESAAISAKIRLARNVPNHVESVEALAHVPFATLYTAGRVTEDQSAVEVTGGVYDWNALLAHSPLMRSVIGSNELDGSALVDVSIERDRDATSYTFDLDATESAIYVPSAAPLPRVAGNEPTTANLDEPTESASLAESASVARPLFAKRRGVPLTLSGGLLVRPPRIEEDSSRSRWVLIRPGVLQLGQSSVEIADGSARFDEAVPAARPRGSDPISRLRGWLHALKNADVAANIRCDLTHDDGLEIPQLQRLLAPYEVSGLLTAQVVLSARHDSARCVAAMNADLVSATAPDVYVKPAGDRLRASWDVTLQRRAHQTHEIRGAISAATDADGEVDPPAAVEAHGLTVHDFVIDAPPLSMRLRGAATREPDADSAPATRSALSWSADAAIDVTDLAEAADGWALPTLHPRRGGFHARLTACGDRNQVRLDDFRLEFNDACFAPDAAESPEHDLCLDGDLAITPGVIRSNNLGLRLGEADVRLALDIAAAGARFTNGVTGTFLATSRYADTGRLMPRVQVWHNALLRLQRQFSGERTSRTPADAPPRTALPNALLRFAGASDLAGQVHVRDAVIPHLAGAGPFAAHELVLEPALRRGRFELPFRTAVNGGVVTGRIDCTLDRPNPWFDLAYEARDLSSEPNTRPLVEAFFPGLTVEGPITLIDATHQRLFDEPGVPNPALGSGEMILGRGAVVGRAAPLAVTRIFPGLNLTRFDFTRMHNRFEKQPDGRMDNQMVFYGANYHMYVDGASFADGRIRYEVGIDLYANLIPTLSNKGQGRIAIFIKTGRRGPNNTLLDETVSYLRPDQLLAKILSDNVLTQTYHVVTDKLR